MTEAGEAELILAAQRGSPDAFARLVARHQQAVTQGALQPAIQILGLRFDLLA